MTITESRLSLDPDGDDFILSRKALCLEPQPFLSPRYHGLRGNDLVIGSGRRGLHIDDHRVLNIDQVIEPVAQLDVPVFRASRPKGRPLR